MTKEIEGYEGRYYITDNGDVFNIKRSSKLSPSVSSTAGYLKISLTNSSGARPTYLLHRLVAMAFIPNPENKREVNHKDGNKANNHVSNLEWATPSENIKHALENGLIKVAKGEDNYAALLTNDSVLEIFNSNLTPKKLSENYDVDICVIYQIKNGQNWSSVTGKKYKAKTSRRSKEFLMKIYSEVGENSDIGKKYNLTTKDVWRIKNTKTLINK